MASSRFLLLLLVGMVFLAGTNALNLNMPVACRHLLAGGRRSLLQGGGWMGGIGTEDMISENDAAGAIYNAVDNDSFGSTYSAAQSGYMDADAATYPDDDAGEFWLNQPGY